MTREQRFSAADYYRYIEGDLPQSEAEALEAHVEANEEARERLDTARRLVEDLGTLEPELRDADICGPLWERLETDADRAAPAWSARSWLARSSGRARVGAGVASLAALAAAGIGGAAGMASKKGAKGPKGTAGDESVDSAAGIRLSLPVRDFASMVFIHTHTHIQDM